MENGQTNGTTAEAMETVRGLTASAACKLGIGTMLSDRLPLMVAVPLSRLAEVKAEATRMGKASWASRRAANGITSPSTPDVRSLSDEYLAECIGEVIARQERIRQDAEARIAKLQALIPKS